MLAEEIKLCTLDRQRSYIEKKLSEAFYRENANPAYVYVGEVYEENIKYFESEGFKVIDKTEQLTAQTMGLPAYLFTIREGIEVNSEEKNDPQTGRTEPSRIWDDVAEKWRL